MRARECEPGTAETDVPRSGRGGENLVHERRPGQAAALAVRAVGDLRGFLQAVGERLARLHRDHLDEPRSLVPVEPEAGRAVHGEDLAQQKIDQGPIPVDVLAVRDLLDGALTVRVLHEPGLDLREARLGRASAELKCLLHLESHPDGRLEPVFCHVKDPPFTIRTPYFIFFCKGRDTTSLKTGVSRDVVYLRV